MISSNNNNGVWLRWFLQRITALVLVACLAIHLILLHFISPERKFHLVLERIQGDKFWGFFYLVFLLTALFHGLNGSYEILEDYLPEARNFKKFTVWFLWLLGIFCFVYGTTVLWKWLTINKT